MTYLGCAIPRRAGALGTAVVCSLAALALTGCATGDQAEHAFEQVRTPTWFTAPRDVSDDDADPPRWRRTYARLPRSQSDVELAYSQALDRAGWRFQAGKCGDAPPGGAIKSDCWVGDGVVLAFVARHDGAGGGDGAPTRLEVVVHEIDA
jgi:hypothetical protein